MFVLCHVLCGYCKGSKDIENNMSEIEREREREGKGMNKGPVYTGIA